MPSISSMSSYIIHGLTPLCLLSINTFANAVVVSVQVGHRCTHTNEVHACKGLPSSYFTCSILTKNERVACIKKTNETNKDKLLCICDPHLPRIISGVYSTKLSDHLHLNRKTKMIFHV